MPRLRRTVSSAWRRLLSRIPHFDPFRLAEDSRFDPERAQLALDFFPQTLTHTKGELAGTPFVLQPWQSAIVANIFGWVRPDGTRRFREAFLGVARKNGKTSFGAGLALFALLADGEKGAEIYCAASDKDQAGILFGIAREMVRANPDFRRHVRALKDTLSIQRSSSFVKVLSRAPGSKHGFNGHCILLDELHAHPSRDLADVLLTSTASRAQPLTLYFTTSDYHRVSICNEKWDYAARVRDGIIDDAAFLPVIYEASPGDDWTRVSTWRKANPNYRISVREDYLARECARALELPAYENTFKRLHLNLRTEQESRWLQIRLWDDSAGEEVDEDSLQAEPAWGGLDLSAIHDLSALALVFRKAGRWTVLMRFWAPREGALRRERTDGVPYTAWARAGYLELTEGNVIDYDVIGERIRELAGRYEIQALATDPFQAQHLINTLTADGLPIVKFKQSCANFWSPCQELERALAAKRLHHGGHPILRWCASNVMLEHDSQARYRPSKRKSTDRIDGIVALTMALAMATQGEDSGSVYDRRGLIDLGETRPPDPAPAQ